MADIRHKLIIKASPEEVYQAVTTQKGLSGWWCKKTKAKPETGFVNIFPFQKFQFEMKVTDLIPNKIVEWKCINSIEEWIGTTVSFDIEVKDINSILRFTHAGWKAMTDTFAVCSYDWAMFLKSLKSLCETGKGEPV